MYGLQVCVYIEGNISVTRYPKPDIICEILGVQTLDIAARATPKQVVLNLKSLLVCISHIYRERS
jgi:hypothetical protein